MKKAFKDAELEIIVFEARDIITASEQQPPGPPGGGPGGGGGQGGTSQGDA